jgi:O-antigen/teichoic acid export membrane protein
MIRKVLRGNGELAGLIRDSALQGVAQAVAAIGLLVQVALITHQLGLRAFGTYSLVIAFVTLVQQFIDVRVEAATITFGVRALKENPRAAAGVIQWSYLVDLGTGVAGFVIVAALAPFVGPSLIGADGTAMILIFGVTLLTSTVDGTSGAALRLFDRYPLILWNAILREILRVTFVAIAVFGFDGLLPVFVALLAHDIAGAVSLTVFAARAFRRRIGRPLLHPALDAIRDIRRDMLRMVLHTNVAAYGRMAQTQLPPLILGWFLGPLEVGLYKIGTAAGLAVGRLTDPVLKTILPRLSRLWNDGKRDELVRLLRRVTAISVPILLLAVGVLALLRVPVLELLGGPEARAAGTVLVLAAAAQALAGMVFWAGPLLLAAGEAARTARIQLVGLAVQIPAAVVLARAFGAEGAVIALLASYIVVLGGYTYRAVGLLRHPPPAPPAGDGSVEDPALIAETDPRYE